MENFDRLVDELERQIIEQARATYSDKVVEEFYYLKNLGRMPEPDACGIVHGWCGDTMEIYLRLNGEQIEKASFMTDGCGPTTACGSMLTKLTQGMSLEEAGRIRPQDLIDALDGLKSAKRDSGELSGYTGGTPCPSTNIGAKSATSDFKCLCVRPLSRQSSPVPSVRAIG